MNWCFWGIHKWSRWELYTLITKYVNDNGEYMYETTTSKQRRDCERCGKRQERAI